MCGYKFLLLQNELYAFHDILCGELNLLTLVQSLKMEITINRVQLSFWWSYEVIQDHSTYKRKKDWREILQSAESNYKYERRELDEL